LNPSLKFIFLTGHGSKDDYEVGSAEANFYLSKPLRIEDLLEALEEVNK
jgi:CheY-like chemotaxis protein